MSDKDLVARALEPVAGDPRKAIEGLYVRAETHALQTIDWYMRAKRSKSWAGTVRYLAITLTTVGGVVPVVKAMDVECLNGEVFGQLGYLLFALAAGLIAFDRFSGISTGWIRYVTSALALQRALREFQLSWAQELLALGSNPPGPEQQQRLIGLLRQFVAQVDLEVEKETQAWAAEFQSSLAELEKTARAQAEAGRPGAIEVRLPNVALAQPDGVAISLDGRRMQERVVASPCLLPNVPPGTHLVEISATVAGVEQRAAATAAVGPGQVAAVTVTLPG